MGSGTVKAARRGGLAMRLPHPTGKVGGKQRAREWCEGASVGALRHSRALENRHQLLSEAGRWGGRCWTSQQWHTWSKA